jgi:hypothetical protein
LLLCHVTQYNRLSILEHSLCWDKYHQVSVCRLQMTVASGTPSRFQGGPVSFPEFGVDLVDPGYDSGMLDLCYDAGS